MIINKSNNQKNFFLSKKLNFYAFENAFLK
jgi:hypothetical protein